MNKATDDSTKKTSEDTVDVHTSTVKDKPLKFFSIKRNLYIVCFATLLIVVAAIFLIANVGNENAEPNKSNEMLKQEETSEDATQKINTAEDLEEAIQEINNINLEQDRLSELDSYSQ